MVLDQLPGIAYSNGQYLVPISDRPPERAVQTRVTQMSDPERDEWRVKCAALRDEISQTKLITRTLRGN